MSAISSVRLEREGDLPSLSHQLQLLPLYVDVIVRRYEAATGESAVRVESGETFEPIGAPEGNGGNAGLGSEPDQPDPDRARRHADAAGLVDCHEGRAGAEERVDDRRHDTQLSDVGRHSGIKGPAALRAAAWAVAVLRVQDCSTVFQGAPVG